MADLTAWVNAFQTKSDDFEQIMGYKILGGIAYRGKSSFATGKTAKKNKSENTESSSDSSPHTTPKAKGRPKGFYILLPLLLIQIHTDILYIILGKKKTSAKKSKTTNKPENTTSKQ